MIAKNEVQLMLKKIKSFKMSTSEKKRMLKFFQVRGSNKINKVMTYKNFVALLQRENGVITDFVIGPEWNRVVFVDIDVEI
jgi:hypothetical protein